MSEIISTNDRPSIRLFVRKFCFFCSLHSKDYTIECAYLFQRIQTYESFSKDLKKKEMQLTATYLHVKSIILNSNTQLDC